MVVAESAVLTAILILVIELPLFIRNANSVFLLLLVKIMPKVPRFVTFVNTSVLL